MKEQKITEFISVQMITHNRTPCPAMVHIPTQIPLKIWAAVEGLEEGAWWAMVGYAERAVQLDCVHWETKDSDFLFPCANFVDRYMDFVGTGEKTIEEVSAELMIKVMRENF